MDLTRDLISWWELDEATGTRIDRHGKNHLTNNSTVGQALGSRGVTVGAFATASSRYLSATSNPELQAGDIDFTFMAVVKFASLDTMVIVGKDVDTPGSSRDYTLDYDGATTDLRFYVNGGGGGLIAVTDWTSTTQWAVVFGWHSARGDTVNIQVNNGSVASSATGGAAPQVSAAQFRIGARAYAGFEGFFNGNIGPVAYWKRVPSDKEREWLWNKGLGRSYSDFTIRGWQGREIDPRIAIRNLKPKPQAREVVPTANAFLWQQYITETAYQRPVIGIVGY